MPQRDTLPPVDLTAARRVVADPSPDDSTNLRTIAWAALKSARGQTVHQRHLPRTFTGRAARLRNILPQGAA